MLQKSSGLLDCYGYERSKYFYYHRVGGPARVSEIIRDFYVAGRSHNLNSPSTESKASVVIGEVIGTSLDLKVCITCSIAGKLHSITGPAVLSNYCNEWWINGVKYTEAEYNRILKADYAWV